jgi:hydrogenase maturation protease
MAKIIILGIGNVLLEDEGIGVHVARALKESLLPDYVEIIDGGISPDIFYLAKNADKLIVVDAAICNSMPGTIYKFTLDDLDPKPKFILSTHEVNLVESLGVMRALDVPPKEVVIIAVEPKEIDWGLELSLELERKIPKVIELVLEEVECFTQSKNHLKRS